MSPRAPVLALALWWAAGMASAELATGAGKDSAAGPAESAANWSAAMDKTLDGMAVSDHGKELSKGVAQDDVLLKEHLTREEEKRQAANGKPDMSRNGPPAKPLTAAEKAASARDDDWGNAFFNAIRDFVKPIKKEVSELKVVQAIRQVDQKIGNDSTAEKELVPKIVLLDPVGPATSPEQRLRDREASSYAFQQFVQEIKPYAIGLGTLMVVGYLATVWWNYVHWKNKRNSQSRSPSRSSRSSRTSEADRPSQYGPLSQSGPLSQTGPLSQSGQIAESSRPSKSRFGRRSRRS